jgi:two-component system chemotaxis response regulator CheY
MQLASVRKMNDGSDALRVLVVEDSPAVADRLKEVLRELPGVALVDTLNRESAAIEKIALGGIDVIILDLHLARGTGFGVLRSIKAAAQTNERPVAIIFTNYDLPEYRRQALALGAQHFLDKARDFERIPAVLSTIREQRHAQRPVTH